MKNIPSFQFSLTDAVFRVRMFLVAVLLRREYIDTILEFNAIDSDDFVVMDFDSQRRIFTDG